MEDKKSVDNFLGTRFYINDSNNWDLIDANGILTIHNSERESVYGRVEVVGMFDFLEGNRCFRQVLESLNEISYRTLPDEEARKHLLVAQGMWLRSIRRYGEEIDLSQIGRADASFLGKQLALVFTQDYLMRIDPYQSPLTFSPIGFTHSGIAGIKRVVKQEQIHPVLRMY